MSSLDMAKWVNENTYNHRCPYCGDSQKNKYKSRGYHFVKEQSFIYKCHNLWKNYINCNFIKDNYPVQHKEYLKEWLRTRQKTSTKNARFFKTSSPHGSDHLNTTTDDSLKSVATKVTEDANARNYLLNRKIPEEMMKDLWYVENAEVLSF